jgi:peptide chain release factor subunit 1
MNLEPMTRRQLKLKLKELEAIKGRGTSMVSLYIPPTKTLQYAKDWMMSEYTLAGNVKSRVNRQSVEYALTRTLSVLRSIPTMPENGFVIFQSDSTDGFLVPPDRVVAARYQCDDKYILEPLKEMVEDPTLFALIVMDRAEATFGFLRGRRIVQVKSIESNLIGKHDAGGQSQRRFERIMENEALGFYRKVGEIANILFGPVVSQLQGILVGGPGRTKDEFIADGSLRYDLKAKLIKQTFNTGYTSDQGLKELVEAADTVLQDTMHQKERLILEKFFTLIKTNPDIIAVGPTEVGDALENGQVDTLILGEEVSKFDEFSLLAERHGSWIYAVSDESETGKQFIQGFGGYGAILRY